MENQNGSKPHREIEKPREISLFRNNNILDFVFKKAEKISCAVYLVTDHYSEKEPLKWSLRDKILSLLEEIITFRVVFSDNLTLKDSLSIKILEIISLLDLSFSAGLISDMNYRIIKQESLKLANFVGSKTSLKSSPQPSFEGGFFNVELKDSLEERVNEYNLERNSIKDIPKGQEIKRHLSFRNNEKDISVLRSKIQNKTGERKRKILAVIKEKREVSVKDITNFITDCSEKTIQRDLVSLVKENILKKTGERRWSRYMLA
jgi:hypothetical protein